MFGYDSKQVRYDYRAKNAVFGLIGTAVWPYYNNAKRSIDEQNYSSEHITCYVQKATELPNQLLDGYSLFFLEPLMNSALFW